jgi:hypothetical protein
MLLSLIFGVANASELNVFPSLGEAMGITLPAANAEQINSRLNSEILQRFDFDKTWKKMVTGRVLGEVAAARLSECGDKLGNQKDFIVAVLIQRKYDTELSALVENTNAVVRAREAMMYGVLPTEKQYAQLKAFPVNDLSKQFVAHWLTESYNPKDAYETLARLFLRKKCQP